MGKPFRRTRAGVRVQLDAPERALLARLLDDVEGLLAADAAERETAAPPPGVNGTRGPAPGGPAPGGPVPGGPVPAGDPVPAGGRAPRSDDDVLAQLEASLATPPPSDPAVARLLPDGHRDDPDLAAGYRRLTEHGLRERKRAGLELAAKALGRGEPVVLDRPEAAALLKGLTDVRLVLAERLGLRTDEDAEALHHALARATALEDPRLAAAALYDALTWWQESLISALR